MGFCIVLRYGLGGCACGLVSELLDDGGEEVQGAVLYAELLCGCLRGNTSAKSSMVKFRFKFSVSTLRKAFRGSMVDGF